MINVPLSNLLGESDDIPNHSANLKKNVVVIGGGTGAYTVLTGLKKLSNINITAIVTSADSGGSTGILRDQFGVLPVGDFRQCIVALADFKDEKNNILRELMKYRFDKGGSGLEGHNFGNLFITALTEILGSQEKAFKEVSRIFNVKGNVYPVTFDKIQLVAEYDDGTILYGEKMIDEPPTDHDFTAHIKRLWVQPKAQIYLKSKDALLSADLIVLGPGDLYTSTLANIVVDDVTGIINNSKAKIVYLMNLMTKYGQTNDFTARNHIEEVEKYLHKKIDCVFVNTAPISDQALAKYKLESAKPVIDDLDGFGVQVVRQDLLSSILINQNKSDKVKRTLLRHSSTKISQVIGQYLQNI